MTNDELVKQLQAVEEDDFYHYPATCKAMCDKAANRIEELEVALEEAGRQTKKLEALVEKVVAWEGKNPTHVIVPVEPMQEMIEAGWEAYWKTPARGGKKRLKKAFRSMIKAAQEQPK